MAGIALAIGKDIKYIFTPALKQNKRLSVFAAYSTNKAKLHKKK